jgi:A/G-specific adenine glycosylase
MSELDADALLAWYDAHARDLPWRVRPADRDRGLRADPYRVWLSEIMLQQTTVAAVGSYYARFLSLWPAVADLAGAPLDAVLVEWAGLGYYARARNLHACARAVVERFGGTFPDTIEGLRSLPGVGPYTAAAIAAIAFDAPVPVIDGNVERVMARYLALEVPPRDAKAGIAAALSAAMPARPGDFAQALMDLGAMVCTPRQASCMLCPLQPCCLAARENPLTFPVKPEKAVRPTRHGHAFVLLDADGDVYLRKRPPEGLLGGMSETPTSDWSGTKSDPAFPSEADWTRHGQVVHVFTHFRLELEVWSARISDPAVFPEGWWAERGTLARQGLPTVFRKVLAAAGLD